MARLHRVYPRFVQVARHLPALPAVVVVVGPVHLRLLRIWRLVSLGLAGCCRRPGLPLRSVLLR